MSYNVMSIVELSPDYRDACIKCTIKYKSDIVEFKKEDANGKEYEGWVQTFLLADDSGEIKSVVFGKDEVERFNISLIHNKMYSIKKFKIVPANSKYNTTWRDWELRFNKFTVFEEIK